MSDMAIPIAGQARPKTWRDAVTPLSRASRQRWTLAYALLLGFALYYWGFTEPTEGGAGTLAVVSLFVVFGMLRRGTRRLAAFDHPGLDERDIAARDRAFRLAYPLLLVVLVALLVVLVVSAPGIERTISHVNGTGYDVRETESGSYLSPNALVGITLWVALWAVFLPTGVLAWREPDAIEPDPGDRPFGVSENVRDVLLGAALVAGLALGLVQDADGYPLLPLIAVLMALGALARRAAGQAPVQRATVVWLLGSLLLAAAILAALFLAVGAGGGG